MNNKSTIGNIISWIFAIIVFAIGIVNTFWGNDTILGVGLLLLSCVYIPPANAILREKAGFSIPVIAKIILGLLIIWVALGVGELPGKIDLMMNDL